MSVFRPRGAEARHATVDNTVNVLERLIGGGRVHAGVPVNDDQALRLSAVWGCVDLIAEIVSTLPVDEYRNTGPGGTPEEQPVPALLRDPGGDGYGFEVWARALMTSLLLRGNAYGLVMGLDDRMNPTAIELLHPDRVSFRRERSMGPPDWFVDGKPIDRWPTGDAQLWHVPAYSIPGSPVGLSPISYAAQTIGLGLATQKFGAQWFGDGAHPTSMLHHESPLAQVNDAEAMKRRVMDATSGNREPLVLGGGWQLDQIQVAPNESQFLETIQANADDVARFFFRRPPDDNAELNYASVEARRIELLAFTINGWLVRLEKALTRLRPRGRFVKINAGAMLRTDTKTIAEVDVLRVRGGLETPNERRRLHDLPPLPGGDDLLWPPFSTSTGTEDEAPGGGGAMEEQNDVEES